MAEPTNELIYEVLKSVQGGLARVETKVDGLAAELRIMKGHMASFLGNEVLQDTRIAEIEARIDRIERRLELVD